MISEVMRITVRELTERQGISRAVLLELVEYEIARPLEGTGPDEWILPIQTCTCRR